MQFSLSLIAEFIYCKRCNFNGLLKLGALFLQNTDALFHSLVLRAAACPEFVRLACSNFYCFLGELEQLEMFCLFVEALWKIDILLHLKHCY